MNLDGMPQHFSLLTPSDLREYMFLRGKLIDQAGKSKKGERLDGFLEKVLEIRRYIEKGDDSDWRRSVACGLIFLSNQKVAIHIQQLKILMGKCKSSINGSFQQLGFSAMPQSRADEEELYVKVPLFHAEHNEIKKWTLRENKKSKNILSLRAQSTPSAPAAEVPKKEAKAEMEAKTDLPFSFPCPLKFQSKVYKLLFSSVAVQTEG